MAPKKKAALIKRVAPKSKTKKKVVKARAAVKKDLRGGLKAPKKDRPGSAKVSARGPRATGSVAWSSLIIVESPSKAKTIQKYLGRSFKVRASVGHIKDLPKSKLGVDVDKNFKPEYQVINGKDKVIDEIKELANHAKTIYLATDPDREGEAIAWHIAQEIPKKGKKVHRVLFNAVTKNAILEAMKTPVKLDEKKFNSQQARRILDRLVGYKISPILWEKVQRGLSAGRVQSVAVRAVVEREAAIKAFKAEEYWSFHAIAQSAGANFEVMLAKINGEKFELHNEKEVNQLVDSFQGRELLVKQVNKRERTRKPQAPFITSRMQQEAARKLGFSAKKTMTLAQMLYEGIDLGDAGTQGLITYMRTDSVRVSPEAVKEVREFIERTYGKEYLSEGTAEYKTKKNAQDAHEAIRPASLEFTPEKVQHFVEPDVFRLYQLVWNRFVSSQMSLAVYDQTSIDLEAQLKGGKTATFRCTGSKLKFAGFTAVYDESKDETTNQKAEEVISDELTISTEVPNLNEGDKVKVREFKPEQHFTQPPPRFNDATLIKEMEEKGIGRPSTYAAILTNIQDRRYVEKRGVAYAPTELGIVVTDLLVQAFPEILNSDFTAEMEKKLDQIEEGSVQWIKMMKSFWGPFFKTLTHAKKHMKDIKSQEIPTEHNCVKCGTVMLMKWGKLGQFLACKRYPECKQTEDFKKDDDGKIIIVPKQKTDKKCPKCTADLVVKTGRFGRFLACEKYPECKHVEGFTIGIHCPECKEGEIAERQSRFKKLFYSCNRYPKCTYALWDKPVVKECPDCKHPLLVEKTTKRDGAFLKCPKKECGYREMLETPVDGGGGGAGTAGGGPNGKTAA
jgi:DNA topoisomerase-1